MKIQRLRADGVPSYVQTISFSNAWRMFEIGIFDGTVQYWPLEYFNLPPLGLLDKLTGARLAQAVDHVRDALDPIADAGGHRAVADLHATSAAGFDAELRAVVARYAARRRARGE